MYRFYKLLILSSILETKCRLHFKYPPPALLAHPKLRKDASAGLSYLRFCGLQGSFKLLFYDVEATAFSPSLQQSWVIELVEQQSAN